MATVYIHYILFPFFLFNLIKKNCSLSLNVESGRFFLVSLYFLAFSFLGFFYLLVSCVFELLLLLLFLLLYSNYIRNNNKHNYQQHKWGRRDIRKAHVHGCSLSSSIVRRHLSFIVCCRHLSFVIVIHRLSFVIVRHLSFVIRRLSLSFVICCRHCCSSFVIVVVVHRCRSSSVIVVRGPSSVAISRHPLSSSVAIDRHSSSLSSMSVVHVHRSCPLSVIIICCCP